MAFAPPRTDPSGLYTFLSLLDEARRRHLPDPFAVARAVWRRRYGEICPFQPTGSAMSASAAPAWAIIDVETASPIDLEETGAAVYAEHAQTMVLCLAWCLGEGEPQVWRCDPEHDARCPAELAAHIAAGGLVVAHNAEFEMEVWERILVPRFGWPVVPLEQWRCTMALCGAHALQLGLGKATAAFGLPERKDEAGRRLMLSLCRPKKPTATETNPWRHHTLEHLDALAAYCRQDVVAERALWTALPPLPPAELEVWRATVRLNRRGLACDLSAAEILQRQLDLALADWDQQVRTATAGALTGEDLTAPARILAWLRSQGVHEENLDQHTVARLLERQHLSEAVRTVLLARAAVGKSSTAKIAAMRARANADGRIRGSLIYHGATTGRWTGRGIQPQNLPRAEVEDVDACLADAAGEAEAFSLLWGDAFTAAAGCLRGLLVARDGCVLVAADYAQIEARVLLWLAQDPGLGLFASGADIYREMAARIYEKPVEAITKAERQVGKQAVLGLGYGMGVSKFHDTCQKEGIYLAPDLEDRTVQTYRATFAKVKSYWYAVEDAAVGAVREPGRILTVRNRVKFRHDGKHLWVRLPSGRKLCYPFAEVGDRTTPWGEVRPAVTFMAEEQQSRQWVRSDTYGGKLVENLTQAAARDLCATATVQAEAAGLPTVLLCHDEIVCEVPAPEGEAALRQLIGLMTASPDWAAGIPIKAEGWTGRRYRK